MNNIEPLRTGGRMLTIGVMLFGWYLMVPPADPKAPLTEWTRVASYSSAKECKAKRYHDISEALKNQNTSQMSKGPETEEVQKAQHSKCVPATALK